MIYQFFLTLYSLVCKTLALVIAFILALFIVINGMLHLIGTLFQLQNPTPSNILPKVQF
jgi:hypothetical protein